MLGISEGAVKQRLSHGRKKFREAFEGRKQERWWRVMGKNDLKREKRFQKHLEREFQVDAPPALLLPGCPRRFGQLA